MNKWELKAGYHEWNLYYNDEFIYCMGNDILESIDKETITLKDIKDYVEQVVWSFDYLEDDNERDIKLLDKIAPYKRESKNSCYFRRVKDKRTLNKIRKALIEGWSYYIG